MDSVKPLAGGIPMLNINGAAIRRIREEKGLTQLYVATVVGVTTDTISRWENRRYPSIKKENALKLAEALETGLTEILEQTPAIVIADDQPADPPLPARESPEDQPGLPTPQGEPKPEQPALSPESYLSESSPPGKNALTRKGSIQAWAVILLILAAFSLFRWWQGQTEQGAVKALRIMPTHAAPGAIFPVIIQVEIGGERPLSLILKEALPSSCQVVQAVPQASSQAGAPPVLKWIAKAKGSLVYAYMARLKPDAIPDSKHFLNGGITRRSEGNSGTVVDGWNELLVSPHHWADENRDGRIDDEELLLVYEFYGGVENLHFNREQIESIWAADGYRWNQETRDYQIVTSQPEGSKRK